MVKRFLPEDATRERAQELIIEWAEWFYDKILNKGELITDAELLALIQDVRKGKPLPQERWMEFEEHSTLTQRLIVNEVKKEYQRDKRNGL